jgi:hypothetical protein
MGPSGRFLGDIRVISQVLDRTCSTTAYGGGAAVTQNRKQIENNLFLQKNRQEAACFFYRVFGVLLLNAKNR